MADSSPAVPTLTEADRKKVQTVLADFERTWNAEKLAESLSHLPPVDSPLRQVILIGLVRIDMFHQWQAGRRTSVEEYMARFPELGPPAKTPLELIQGEFDTRRQVNAPVDMADFIRRFPEQAEQIRAALETTLQGASNQQAQAPETVETIAHAPSIARRPGLPDRLPCAFGRYSLLRILGQGGMGAVYLAHDEQLDREVALKIPLIAPNDGPDVLPRFYREARAAATLHHASICPVYDVGEMDGTPYLTMAFIEGMPLSDMVKGKKQLPQRQSAQIIRQVALAMQEAHKRGVIHRDLKPSNIHITPAGDPVIMDFGIARRIDKDGERLTRTGQLIGTPEFMAPEQARGDTLTTGPLSDVYSLGVILYRLLSGRVPFEGALLDVLIRITTEDPPPPSQFRPELDPRLEAACLKAMSRKPEDRFASMAELALELDAYLADARPEVPANEPTASDKNPVILDAASLPPGTLLPATFPPDSSSRVLPEPTSSDTALTEPPPPKSDAAKPEPWRPASPSSSSDAGKTIVGVLAACVVVGMGAYWMLTRQTNLPTTGPTVSTSVASTSPGTRPTTPATEVAKTPTPFERAQQAFEKKDFDTAIPLFNDVLAVQPKNALANRLRGLAYLAKENTSQAVKDLTAAIDNDRQDAAALAGRAEAHLRLKQYLLAIADARAALAIDKTVKLDPVVVQAHAGQGQLHLGQKEYPQAIESFNEAVKLDPKDPSLRMHRGDAHRGKGDLGPAIDDFLEAWRPQSPEIDKRLDDSYLQLLEPHLAGKDFAGALDHLDRRIKSHQANPWTYYYRGKLYLSRDTDADAARAVADFTRAMQLDAKLTPELSRQLGDAYQRLGESFFRKKEFAAAVAEFDRRLTDDPKNPWALAMRGRAYQLQGDPKQALTDFNAALKIDGSDALVYRYRGDANAELRHFDEASQDFRNAVERNPSDIRNWSQYLHALLAQDDLPGYRSKCKDMLAKLGKSDDPATLNLLAWLAALVPDAAGDAKVPVQLAETAWNKSTDKTDIFYRNTLAAAQYRAGDPERAARHLEAIGVLRDQRKDQRGNVNDWIFLGLAYQKVGDPKAREWLEKGLRGIDAESKLPTCTWNRRAELDFLRREVEAMLKKAKG